jgi:hypothetical protein
MPLETEEDTDDVFVENLNTAMFLSLGVVAVCASVVLFAYSAIAVAHGLLFSMSFLTTLISAALSFLVGLGSLHLFRKRRKLRKKKTSAFFYGGAR